MTTSNTYAQMSSSFSLCMGFPVEQWTWDLLKLLKKLKEISIKMDFYKL